MIKEKELQKNTIAVITVFNNSQLVGQMKKSVYDTIGNLSCTFYAMENIGNTQFHSAAEAYNTVLNNDPDADVFIFCHQDILFPNDSLQTIYDLCSSNKKTLFGAAGVKNVGHGDDCRIISSMAAVQEGWNFKTLPKGTTQDVFTLDECLICGSRELFETLRFDEQVCDGWHLYAAELCMQCHVKEIDVKVFDADIVHISGGTTDSHFFKCEKKLVKKYRKYFPIISYTSGWAYTDPVRYILLRLYRRLRYGVYKGSDIK